MSPHPKNSNQESADPLAALKIRDFRLFAIGRILIFTSFQMQTVALGWEIYDRTGSALALGGVGLAQVKPMILLTLLAGHVADRHDRKNTILFAIFLSILCSLGLAAISYSVFISASNELGGFESGLAAAAFGSIIAVVGGGIGTIAVVLAVVLKRKGFIW